VEALFERGNIRDTGSDGSNCREGVSRRKLDLDDLYEETGAASSGVREWVMVISPIRTLSSWERITVSQKISWSFMKDPEPLSV